MKVVRDFQGFSPKALTFLEELANNNTKAWFDEHKGYMSHRPKLTVLCC